MKTILFENDALLTQKTKDWVNSIDKNYYEFNSQTREYDRSNDLYVFGMLINPTLENIITSSEFITKMPYIAYKCFNKDIEIEKFTQLEYYAWLIFYAVRFRKDKNIQPLTLYINYKGEDFLTDLKDNILGKDVFTYIKLMLKQSENFVFLKIHKDYKFQYKLKSYNDLKL